MMLLRTMPKKIGSYILGMAIILLIANGSLTAGQCTITLAGVLDLAEAHPRGKDMREARNQKSDRMHSHAQRSLVSDMGQ